MSMTPFRPASHATQKASVVAAATSTLTFAANFDQIWIDNRGVSDVLVEFQDAPVEADSFRVPPNSVVLLSGAAGKTLYLMRPTGATTEDVYATPGWGY